MNVNNLFCNIHSWDDYHEELLLDEMFANRAQAVQIPSISKVSNEAIYDHPYVHKEK